MTDNNPAPFLIRVGDESEGMSHMNHPWNEKSDITMNQLARRTGMSRAIVTRGVIPPGKEGFVYHSHQRDEEWVFVLEGEGVAEVDGSDYPLRPGDFLGFQTPSVAHHLRNDSAADFVFLMGGEAHTVEVADFPKLGKRKITGEGLFQVVDLPED